MKMTPGPWIYASGDVYRHFTADAGNTIRIASVDRNEPHTLPAERDANARLIAAAPELLEALTLFLGIYPDKTRLHPDVRIACSKAQAAIAKATGNE